MPGNVAGRSRTGSLGFHPMEWYMQRAYTGAKEFVHLRLTCPHLPQSGFPESDRG